MRIRLTPTLALIVSLVVASSCFAWGRDGHYIIAEITWSDMTPEARAAVEKLLADDPDCRTFHEASVWADEIRRDPEYQWTAPLHYVNLPPGSHSFNMKRDCLDGDCVVGAIERFSKVLRDRKASVKDRREALKFLVHFVGDVHQPLHVSHRKDRGGNDIAVEFFHGRTNLHRVWDTLLLRHTKKSWSDHAAEVLKTITDKDRESWKRDRPARWATESYRLAVTVAYVIPKDGVLNQEYFDGRILVV